MPDAHCIPIEDLRCRLRAALGPDSLLGRRLDGALRRRDAAAIGAAMDALRLHPEAVRREVEAVMTAWLIDGPHGGDAIDLISA